MPAGIWSRAPATFERVQPGVELGYTDDMGTCWPQTAVDALPAPGVLQDIQAAIDHAAAPAARRHRRLLLGRCADLAWLHR
jgi:carboxymethylenebutenolidase